MIAPTKEALMTLKEIRYQQALDDFRATTVGGAFFKFKNALTRASMMDTEDSFTDKNRAATKRASEDADKAEKELLKLLNAPTLLTKD